MALHFIGIDPETDGDHCPTVWFDDETRELVVQGWKAGRELMDRCREFGAVPDGEAVVRIPARMVHLLRKACDAAERAALS
ncbi:hypothetical protein ACFXP3_23930 [Streptomyces sp. NPDC059096]|uniref:hypothetical protein n=1 Tax=unclassified Streptomyces TaxID=2593676 RepID=UPI0036967324